MPESTPPGTSSGDNAGVQSQLAQLVPSFDPAEDSVEMWAQKVELLLQAWPSSRLTELATRIILNTKGSAFSKLQLRQAEVLTGDAAGIKKIVEIVGGQFGQISLEKKYDIVEKALFKCIQKNDETSDSFLARSDVVWTELLMKKVTIAELQAYVLLRGSRLTSEDKKRVLVESGAELGGALDVSKVSAAIRMLGSSFFQEYTSGKKEKSGKTYDVHAFAVDEIKETAHDEPFWPSDEIDEETVEAFAAMEDEDASMVLNFEGAILECVQEDADLAAYFSAYQDARRRLNEKARFRGFWPVGKGKSHGKKGSFGKGKGKGRRSLAYRIANSTCKICHEPGHWKAECPNRKNQGESTSKEAPTSFVVAVPNEIAEIPEMVLMTEAVACHESVCLGNFDHEWKNKLKTKLQKVVPTIPSVSLRNPAVPKSSKLCLKQPPMSATREDVSESSTTLEAVSLFASSGSNGVVDLGASQTVIGSDQVTQLLENIPEFIRSQVRRTSCNVTFRFGNHQTLTSHHALLFPLQETWFRVAVVQGKTPFLLSSHFLKKTLKAVIDVDEGTLWSKVLQKYLPLTETNKELFTLDLNTLWQQEPEKSWQVQESLMTHDCEAQQSEDNEKIEFLEKGSTRSDRNSQSELKPKSEESSQVDSHVSKSVPCSVQTVSSPCSSKPIDLCPQDVVPQCKAQCLPCPNQGGRSESHDFEPAQRGNNPVRKGQAWNAISRGIRNRSQLGEVHSELIREVHQREHQMFIRYIQLRLQHGETKSESMVKGQTEKPSASGMTKKNQTIEDPEESWTRETEEQVADLQHSQIKTEQRMSRIEENLDMVIQHLQKLNVAMMQNGAIMQEHEH